MRSPDEFLSSVAVYFSTSVQSCVVRSRKLAEDSQPMLPITTTPAKTTKTPFRLSFLSASSTSNTGMTTSTVRPIAT